jgi:hypothetical protein
MRKVNSAKAALWDAEGLTPAQLAERETIMEIARRLSKNGKVTREEFGRAVERRYYRVGSFSRRFMLGIAVEALIASVAFLAFVNTENMRLPMVLIDQWTPLMLLLMVTCWVADVALTRYRVKDKENATE